MFTGINYAVTGIITNESNKEKLKDLALEIYKLTKFNSITLFVLFGYHVVKENS